MRWGEEPRLRPDPYLDWLARISGGEPGAETWCSVRIEILPDDQGNPLAHLQSLLAENISPPIRIAADERAAIETALAHLSSPGAEIPAAALRFFVYLPESAVYDQGAFATHPRFRILHAGPPVPDFNPQRQETRPSTRIPRMPEGNSGAVALGIIDDGIAFAHERFCRKDGRTRIEAIWLQDAAGEGEGSGFGRKIFAADLNRDLAAGLSERAIYGKYGALDYGSPTHQSLGLRGSHGTHVLDLAAGASPEEDCGDRPIFAVQLPAEATADTSGVTMGSYVLQGVRQIMHWADQHRPGLPLVINFSYGMFAGPKDGSHPLEAALADLVGERIRRGAPTALVLPAGNSYRARSTAHASLAEGEEEILTWVLLPEDRTPSQLEIWLDGATDETDSSPAVLTVEPSSGYPACSIQPKIGTVQVLRRGGHPVAGIYADRWNGAAGPRVRLVIVANPTLGRETEIAPAPAGPWFVSVENAGSAVLEARIYVQRDDTPSGFPLRGRQSYLDHPRAHIRNPLTGAYDAFAPDCPMTTRDTLSAIATGARTIVVGGAQAGEGFPPADYASGGPSLGRRSPDCAAFSDEGKAHLGILAAGTLSGATIAMRGTSVAAPQVARLIAAHMGSASCVKGQAKASKVPADPLAALIAGGGFPVNPEDRDRLGAFITPSTARSDLPARRSRD